MRRLLKQGGSEPGDGSLHGRLGLAGGDDVNRSAIPASGLEAWLGDYGTMDADEQEWHQNLYVQLKALCSIVGDEGLGQEQGTVCVDGKAFRAHASSCCRLWGGGVPEGGVDEHSASGGVSICLGAC